MTIHLQAFCVASLFGLAGVQLHAATYQLTSESDWDHVSTVPGGTFSDVGNDTLRMAPVAFTFDKAYSTRTFDASGGMEWRLRWRFYGEGRFVNIRPYATDAPGDGPRYSDPGPDWHTPGIANFQEYTWYFYRTLYKSDGTAETWVTLDDYADRGGTIVTYHDSTAGHSNYRGPGVGDLPSMLLAFTMQAHGGQGTWWDLADITVITDYENFAAGVPAPLAIFAAPALLAFVRSRNRVH